MDFARRKNKKKIVGSILILIFSFAFLYSCGGGGGGSNNGKLAVNPNTIVLDELTTQKIISVSQDRSSLIFSEETPQLQALSPGKIIVCGVTNATPNGLLRKVILKEKVGNQVIMRTSEATIEEAIQDADVTITKKLNSSDIRAALTNREGVYFESQYLDPRQELSHRFYVEIRDLVLYQENDKSIILNGIIAFNPSFTFSVMTL